MASAVGGAIADHEIEKRSQPHKSRGISYLCSFDNGTIHKVTQSNASDLNIGDRARVNYDRVSRTN